MITSVLINYHLIFDFKCGLYRLKGKKCAPFHAQQDRRHETNTIRKSVKNWYIEYIDDHLSLQQSKLLSILYRTIIIY